MKRQRVNVQLKAEGGGAIMAEQRVYLTGSRRFFGPGPCTLLNLIDRTGSLQEACSQMDISYSKGWHMVQNIEDQLGRQVVERHRGGKQGGQSRLTEEGRALVEHYLLFASACEKSMEALFEAHFSGQFPPRPGENEKKIQPSEI